MKSIQKSIIFIVAVSFLAIVCAGSLEFSIREKSVKRVFDKYDGKYVIHVSKKDFTLSVYNRSIKLISNFKIGYGLNPDKKAKLFSGDKRTPEGIYRITEILSMDAGKKTKAYKKLKGMNSVYFSAKDGHSKFGHKDVDLGKNAYGARFFRIDYPNKEDHERYRKAVMNGEIPKANGRIRSIGSGIAIHGNNDLPSIGQLCSSGCVRMYNEDIVELNRFILLQTPVIISAD